jgi:hypothetical protein
MQRRHRHSIAFLDIRRNRLRFDQWSDPCPDCGNHFVCEKFIAGQVDPKILPVLVFSSGFSATLTWRDNGE